MRNLLPLVAGMFLASAFTQAEIVYQNIKDDSNEPETSYDAPREFGDQITLSGTDRWISGFSFEYYADFTPTGDETARLRFYANDGPTGANPSATPGTLLLDTGDFSIQSGYKTARLNDFRLLVPDSFTWTIEFNGISETERAGLLIDENVNIGSSNSTFWEKREEGWRSLTLPGLSANFIAQVIVPPAVVSGSLQIEGGVATLEVEAIPGRVYTLQYKNDLNGLWQNVSGSQVQASSDTVVLQDPGAGAASMRFYRVRETESAG